jgi:hypothetical protein
MNAQDWANARTIIAGAYAKIEAGGGKVRIKQAVFNELTEAGYPDLAEMLMSYSAMEGAVSVSDKPIINIINSQVGNLNLGSQIGNINTSLSVVSQQGASGKDFAEAVKAVTEAVLGAAELNDAQKKEAVQSLEFISQEAATPPEQRKTGVLRTVVESIPKVLSAAASAVAIWAKYGSHIRLFFGF